MTKGSEVAQKPFEFWTRKKWRWRLVYGPISPCERAHKVMMSWIPCLQRWMKLWIVQVCTVDHVKHIGDGKASHV